MSVDWSGRWSHVQKFLERTGPFAHPDFEPSSEAVSFLQDVCKILVIGAGGLGCELLKDLALLGFRNLDVIDMDTIDISNLNRQFLFRLKDVGRPKAECAADFINTRIPGTKVTPHCNRIEDFDESFYRQFHIVVCGLDSIVARRWINGMLISMLNYEDGQLDQSSIVPLVDGGTEGLKGNARVILPGISACVECTLDLYPPQGIGFQKIYVCKTPPDSATKPYTALSPTVFVGKTLNFPLCTIAHTPRLPEHCIEYVRILLWPKEEPFGGGVGIDGDDPKHIQWILDRSLERASEFNITGITYRLTQGVVKRIIPAVASTNAVIAAACATEVFKIATSCCLPLNNYMNFNDTEGIYTYTFEAEKKFWIEDYKNLKWLGGVEFLASQGFLRFHKNVSSRIFDQDDCMACGSVPQTLSFSEDDKLQDIINFLIESVSFQMKSPGVTTSVNGKNRTLYMQTVKSIEERTKQNLKKTLKELGLSSGQELYVADATTPNSLTFKLNLGSKME